MADDAAPEPVQPDAPPSRPGAWRWGRRLATGLALVVLLLVVVGLALDTGPGRRFLADRIAGFELSSGLKLRIGRIDGSIYGAAVLRDVALLDTRRVFFTAPEVRLDWRPLAWAQNRLDIRELVIRRGRLRALPQLNPADPDAPLLPGFDIRIDRLRAAGLVIDKGVAGSRRVANITGSADIRDGRAMIDLDTRLADGSDRLVLTLDAVPDADRLALKADLAAPKGGAIATLAGIDGDLSGRLAGSGRWTRWRGRLTADLGAVRLATIGIAARSGQVTLRGHADPTPLTGAVLDRMLGHRVGIAARGMLQDRVLRGEAGLAARAGRLGVRGGVDLGGNRFEALHAVLTVTRPGLLATGLSARDLTARLDLDGPFAGFTARYAAGADRLALGSLMLSAPRAQGMITARDGAYTIPIDLQARQIVTGNDYADRLAQGLAVRGTARWADGQLSSDPIRIDSRTLRALVQLSGSSVTGRYMADIDYGLAGFDIANIGRAAASGNLRLSIGGAAAWQLAGDFDARLSAVVNDTLVTLVGPAPRLAGDFSYAAGQPFVLRDARLLAEKLALLGGGRLEPNGRIVARASGRHRDYGPIDLTLDSLAGDSKATLVFADPLPALGVKALAVSLGTVPDGFAVEAEGQSNLGPIAGRANIYAREGGRTEILVDRLQVSDTVFSGTLGATKAGLDGSLAIAGGGIDGSVRLVPASEGQRANAAVRVRNARFEGPQPITLATGTIELDALFATGRTTIDASLHSEGLARGRLFIGRIDADASLVNGSGRVTASLSGRRRSAFKLDLAADVAPDRVSISGNGDYAGRRLRLMRPAVLSPIDDGGWQLAPSAVRLGRGRIGLSGRFGGGDTAFDAQFSRVPLALADAVYGDLGFGGNVSGIVSYRQTGGAAPTGKASLQIARLTRSGLVLSSRPVDLAANLSLGADAIAARGTITDQGKVVGRIQARIGDMPQGFGLLDRARRGALAGQLRYNGPADALWRLTGVETFDITGTVAVAMNARGTLADPDVSGALATRTARLESTLSGTVVENITARGRFDGARLSFTRFTGKAGPDGSVTGSGTIDYGGLLASPSRGVAIDLAITAKRALLVNRDDFGATMTGPLTVKSGGNGGVLGGDVRLDNGRFQLGRYNAAERLPNIAFRETNRRADEAPRRIRQSPWRYEVRARADNRVTVTGLGLNSEWGADIALTGTVDAPRLLGTADLVRGEYEFAGRSFDLSRGRITFRNESPPNPALDIEANANLSDISATINVRGTGLSPEISFESIPALPEDELLARLLFGTSLTDISAPEAVQLAAALASLRSGGGLDPINALRGAVGLDRLRIIGADAQTGQGTSIAAGKYITRNTYVEIVTDGRGYSATQIEFQITRWLSILSSISTIGRQSANVRISKDY